MIQMDEESKKAIEIIESRGIKTGVGQIMRGECPMHSVSPVGCTFCSYGHTLDCHYPLTCEEAECSHWKQAMEAECEQDS